MYGIVSPKTKLLTPVLSREYLDYNGITGKLINLSACESYGTFPTWYTTKLDKGATLNDVKGVIAELIANNEDVLNERDSVGRTSLHLICSVHSPGQIDVARALCSAKSANVNVLDSMHRTPLHHVLSPFNLNYHSKFSGNEQTLVALIRLLVEFGANANAIDIKGVSPLHLALDFHYSGFAGNFKKLPAVLKILKQSGADMSKIALTVSYRSGTTRGIPSSLTPLHLACCMDGPASVDAMKFLLSSENVNCTDSLGRTPLHIVIMSLRRKPKKQTFVRDVILPAESDCVMEKVNLLIASRADPNLEDIDGMTPLLTAIELFNYKHSVDIIVKVLLNGALASRRDRERRTTPLHLACQYFDKSLPMLLPYFIKAGGRLNVSDHKLSTPFHYALKKQCCSLATLNYLVKAGCNVLMVDDENNSCVHIVCSSQTEPHFREVVEFLIEKGCSINTVNNHGNTPLLHLLQSDYDKASVQALVELGADCRVTNNESVSPLHLVCRSLTFKGDVEIVDLIIRGGADVNARDRSMSTPLFYAVKDEPTVVKKVVHSLLLAGANPNFANDHGMTPLHVVCSYGNHELARLLIAFGANVNQLNENGNTPLHEAAAARTGDPKFTCQVLIDAGADISARNYCSRTPLLMTNPYQSKAYKFIIGHIVILISAGRCKLNQVELDLLNRETMIAVLYADCSSCVDALKSQRLGNSRMTLWSFLMASPEEGRRYTRNPAILEDLYSISERFRPYADMIKQKATYYEYLSALVDRSVLSLQKIFSKLPLIVAEKIISNLNEFDMLSLNTAVLGKPN